MSFSKISFPACACKISMRSACFGGVIHEYENKKYCVMHYPGLEKSNEFEEVLIHKKNVKDFNFHGVVFPSDIDFSHYTFDNHIIFSSAVFNGNVYFKRTFFPTVDFSFAEFKKKASFEEAVFYKSAIFSNSKFHSTANFNGCDFISIPKQLIDSDFEDSDSVSAKFNATVFKGNLTFDKAKFLAIGDFRSAVFESPVRFFQTIFLNAKMLFGFSSFKDQVRFAEIHLHSNPSLEFFSSIFEKPEQVFFYKAELQPHYFVNVDVRKFNFDNVSFPVLEDKNRVNIEINNVAKKFSAGFSHELLSISCRRLATNAEENNRYEEASNFRRMAMEAEWLGKKERRKLWWSELSILIGEEVFCSKFFFEFVAQIKKIFTHFHRFSPDILYRFYRFTSHYGETWQRAFWLLISIWLISALLYASPFSNFEEPLNKTDTIVYSLYVMALQKPEPKPVNLFTKGLIITETILAPLQAAILALAIRRKFMR